MNIHDIPTPSELLHSFLDGELDSTSEQQLFATLAESGDLRGEMRDLLAMKTAVSGDIEAFTPPADTTKALFASLGFAAPIAISAPVEVPPAEAIPIPMPGATAGAVSVGSKVIGFIQQAWIPVASAAMAAVFAGVVVGNIYENDIKNLEAKNNSGLKQIALLKESRNNSFKNQNTTIALQNTATTLASSELQLLKGSEIINNNTRVLKEIEYRDRQIANLLKENSALKSSALKENTTVVNSNVTEDFKENSAMANISESDIAEFSQPSLTRNPAMELPAQQHSPLPEIENMMENSTLYIRGISARSFPDPADENLKTKSLLNNIAVGYMAPVSENLSLGVEFGQESFGQDFTGTADDGRVFKYEQSPNLIWGAAGARYTFFKAETNIGSVELFGQGMVGGTTLGPVGKGIAGVAYHTGSRMSVMLGAEATTLFYTYQSNSYTTKKLGLTYGISYHF